MARIVVVGLGAGGFSAALAAKKTDRKAEVIIIDKKSYDLVHPCGLPYALEGRIKSFDELKHSINAEKMGMKVHYDSEAIKIEPQTKQITYKNIKTNDKNTIKYNKLIFATGSSPLLPPIKGIEDNKQVFTVDCIEKTQLLEKAAKKAMSAVIVGAGSVGLETAFALKKKGLNVTVVEKLPHAFPNAVDSDISDILEDYLESQKIKFICNAKVAEIKKNEVIFDSNKITADIIVMATGVKPNIEVAKKAGIKTGKFGIIVTNKMETSDNNIYAVGDCVETFNMITKEPWPSPLSTLAYKQGIIAGTNAVGGNMKYAGALTTFVSVVGHLQIAATGLNSYFAKKSGYKFVIGKAKSETKPDWFPGGKELMVKILADVKTGRIIGAQAVGEGRAASRIDIISTAIKGGLTLKDLSDVEIAYCPAISKTHGVLAAAVDVGLKKLEMSKTQKKLSEVV